MHIQIPCSCQTVHVEVRLLREDGKPYLNVPMAKTAATELYETWTAAFALDDPDLYFYFFQITTKNESFRLLKQGDDTNMEDGDWWQISVIAEEFAVPSALEGAVMYQIFPDRFAKSGQADLHNKLQPYWIHSNTHDIPVWQPNERGEVTNNDFFGGNFAGMCEKLDYLHDLGVEVLYLNPIFMAWSAHRYDTYDYARIDPMLGTEDDFRHFCNEAHERGMKVILDGVFSHVGDRSPYFQSAISDPNSPYRSWFQFQHYPDRYTSWWGITTLPCVNKLDPAFLDYIIDGPYSIAARWLMAGADGWRLDVVDELPDEFVLRLRRRIRQVKPSAILIGEVWEDASNKIAYDRRRRYFVDNELDGVMNYPLQKAILRYVRRENDGAEFGQQVMTLAENYPPHVLNACMNLLSTHDTPRAINALLDPHDGSRDDLARRPFLAGSDHLGQGASAHSGVSAIHAPRRALHLLWRRGRDDRLSRPFSTAASTVGRGGHESASFLPCAGAAQA
ncbi:MAG: glycoside hydrolase family 13 protein [Oscillospiraceae bacterium]